MSTSMAQQFKVVVVGGGPVGLTAAHSLHKLGIDFVVLERRDAAVEDLGASLVIGAANLRVMNQLGLFDKLLEVGTELDDVRGFLANGKEFKNEARFRMMKENHGIAPVAFHRANLVKVLYDNLPEAAKARYLMNKKVNDIETLDNGVKVTCEDGTVYEGDMVLGADGVHSNTRKLMRQLALKADPNASWDPQIPFKAEYKCLWGNFTLPPGTSPGKSYETVDKDRSVMFITGQGRGWLFLYERLPESTTERHSYSTADCEAFAATFAHYPVGDNLTVKDVFERRLLAGMSDLQEGIVEHWSWAGRVVLAGDAAHKFTPNAGLGYNNGIQDVVALCNELKATMDAKQSAALDATTLDKVFQEYRSSRLNGLTREYDVSAMVTRMQSWATWMYYFMSRFIMHNALLVRWSMQNQISPSISKALVLNGVHATEVLNGAVPWVHRLSPQ